MADPGQISFPQFKALARHNSSLIRRAVEGNLAVPDFAALTADITRMYGELLPVTVRCGGRLHPAAQAGRPGSAGDRGVHGRRPAVLRRATRRTAFCLQSVSKTVSYCLALDEHGTDAVHQHVGREPSGQSFNELALNPKGLPHNPMVNAGAIMTTSLIRPEADIADRFDQVAATWQRLAGGRRPGFNNAVYLSERQTADRNFALGYSMRESGAFRPGTDLLQTLEFYFQGCSIEVDAQMLAMAAASLANAGVCPLTEDPVFTPGTVQSCLSLMSSCGMYDFSGEFAFTIGLPAKSGVSGALMLVIPGLMGICVWSPRLDEHGNSVRGIEFCRKLVAEYNVHVFDSLVTGRGRTAKRDPRRKKNQTQTEAVVALTWAASQGDLNEVRALIASGRRAGHRRLRRPHPAAPGRRRRPAGGGPLPAGGRRRPAAGGPLGRHPAVRRRRQRPRRDRRRCSASTRQAAALPALRQARGGSGMSGNNVAAGQGGRGPARGRLAPDRPRARSRSAR